ncbi:MAG TPA: Holliday junction branch migration protein RuvA [Patescibacteria group bacterium]|jgi:Holliday junction DNA helicase RuvA|nr:Holliday junction branch migration protein RuvA [Patescibacteria group bacterium]
MISTLTGKVTEQLGEVVVLNVAGVGYGLWVPQEDWGHLSTGAEVKVYVYEHIREQTYDLYGFLSPATKSLFEQLLSVNGVGPRMALAILSVGSINEVRAAIAEGNVKYLQAASGVGKKVAERIVVDLKDKVGLGLNPDATTFLTNPVVNRFDEAQEALVSLGFSAQDAATALGGVDPKLSIEERVKLALRGKTK